MKIGKLFLTVLLLTLGIQTINNNNYNTNNAVKVSAGLQEGLEGDPINTDKHAQEYYSSIDGSLTGASLLKQLQSLNAKERTRTVGYKNMWDYYDQTDYDPNNSSRYLAYYRGTSASRGEMNKEHVWPDSRGGGTVDGDIHMPRPTLTSDNSSRGNSFYVEGMCHSSNGWDPYADGMKERYRGDAARIIFYCVVANSSLKLVDKDNDSTSNNSMGKLSDLLKWNLSYPVDESEIRRNEGAEDIQGNRNPFIDDRSLACKIWGDTNETTRNVCRDSMKVEPPTKIDINPKTSTINVGGKISLGLSVTPNNASKKVVWSTSDDNVATVSENGEVTGLKEGSVTISAYSSLDNNIFGEATIYVREIKSISLSGTANKTIYNAGEKFNPTGIAVTATYSDNSTSLIDSNDLNWVDSTTGSQFLSEGTTSVIGSTGKVSATYSGIIVNPKPKIEGAVLVEDDNTLNVGDKLVLANKESGVVAGTLNGKYLNPESATFSSNGKIIEKYDSAKVYTLGGTSGHWTLNSDEGLLGTTAEKSMVFGSGTTTWDISISYGNATIKSTTSSYGTLQYNKSAPRFTTYKSSQQLINVYRLENVNDTPSYPSKELTELTSYGALNKSQYKAGEVFDPSGLTIKAHYNDGSSKDVSSLVKWPTSSLTVGISQVTGSYTENNITKTIKVDINVIKDSTNPPLEPTVTLLNLIEMNSPNKVVYSEGEVFDPTGIIVFAFYSDGSNKDVTNLMIWPTTPLDKDTKNIEGTYTEDNVSKNITIKIIVVANTRPNGCTNTGASIIMIMSVIGTLAFALFRKKD